MTKNQTEKLELYDAYWKDILPHLERDAVILVNENLDLIKVAEVVANDDSKTLNLWIESSLVAKPTQLQIKDWEKNLEKLFQCVIVQPYVLIKEIAFH